tara:strand:- start:102 stop:377 length:276 start_codon:yes stop_codon:yes gene_type:complete
MFDENYKLTNIRKESLQTVVEYLYYDEKKHFEEVTGFDGDEEDLIIKIHNAIIHDDWSEFPDGEDHIFRHLTVLAFWDRLEEEIRRNTYGE